MNFNIPLIRSIRISLFPLSLLYWLGIWIRNKLYDKQVFKSASYNLPIIGIGNLAAGGSGKSPMVEYMLRHFSEEYKTATLSRGYKRRTRGYALANEKSDALEIGDEPLQFYLKFPHISVAVGEERTEAIPQLLHDRPETQLIILDDAFQHRKVKAGLDIVLTDYSNLYTRDWYLPTGDLRDERASAKRADILVVTKCPQQMTEEESRDIIAELKPRDRQPVFFTTIHYGEVIHINQPGRAYEIDADTEVLLVSGIANPRPLKAWLAERSRTYYHSSFSDHRIYTIDDLRDMIRRYEDIQHKKKIILTTEKDAMRLLKFGDELKDLPFYVLPIEHRFLFNGDAEFGKRVRNFVEEFGLG